MSYRAVSPQLKLSCYNCRHFQVSGDMLNGFCMRTPDHKKAAIGIGTCDEFSIKEDHHFSWSNILGESADHVRHVPQ